MTASDQNGIETLRRLLSEIEDEIAATPFSSRKRKILEGDLRGFEEELARLLARLDPIGQPSAVFDPSNPKVIGRFVSLALVAQKRQQLSNIPRTYGSGVYAIYFNGDFPLYEPLRGSETPIYVGQAAPVLSTAKTPREQGPRLSSRLADHQKNIAKAEGTLKIADFEFRSLVVQSGCETAAEDYLIHFFRPIWNSETNILYGLGKHGDDAATRANKRSPWDTLHPGRKWAAASTQDAKDIQQISIELENHFTAHPVFRTLDDVLTSFIEELRQI